MKPTTDLSERLVAAMDASHGVHEGYRAAHASGVTAVGAFRATPEAAALSRAAHLHGAAVPATVRFSNGGGNPRVPDGARDGRGVAVKLALPGGASTDLVGLSLPLFFSRTPRPRGRSGSPAPCRSPRASPRRASSGSTPLSS